MPGTASVRLGTLLVVVVPAPGRVVVHRHWAAVGVVRPVVPAEPERDDDEVVPVEVVEPVAVEVASVVPVLESTAPSHATTVSEPATVPAESSAAAMPTTAGG
jgi:hypothetical protein